MHLGRAITLVTCMALGATALAWSPIAVKRSFSPAAAAASSAHGPHAVTGRAGGTRVSVTVRATRGPVVTLAVTVSVSHPDGALTYSVAYGDGTTASPPAPQLCVRSSSAGASRTWHLRHRYRHPGTYRVAVTGWAVCTPGRAKAAVLVKAG